MRFKIQKVERLGCAPAKMRGLGDLVAKGANPIKRQLLASDYVPESIKHRLKNCHCKERQDFLNSLWPFVD